MSIPPATPTPARSPVKRAPVPTLPEPRPGNRTDLGAQVGAALRVAAGDLDGDGQPELVLVDAEHIRVVDHTGSPIAEAPVFGGIRALEVVDAPSAAGDRPVIAAGWGDTAQHRQTPTRISLYRLQGRSLVEEVVASPQTTRNDVTAILSAGRELLLAYFDSKYVVKAVLARKGAAGWALRDLAELRMAMSWARGDVDGDGRADLVVGRLYGDTTGVDGDAFWLRPDGRRVPVPTTRGVRGLAVVDSDGDHRGEVFLGDGWHQSYGTQARGLLTWSRWDGHAFHSQTIEDTPGQYAVFRIFPADVDGDGKPEIVTMGNAYVRVFRRERGRWKGLTVAGACRDVVAANLDGQPGEELVVVGDRSERIGLSGVRWP
jgi:hypothetical protein